MHRLCSEKDRGRILSYISFEPEVNLYILGDIEAHGIEYPVTVAAFGPEDGWEAIVLGLFNNFVVYSRCQQYDSAEISEYIRGAADDGTPRHINARLDIAVSLNPFFPEMSLSPCRLATCHRVNDITVNLAENVAIKRLSSRQYDDLFDLLSRIDESSQHYEIPRECREARERKEASEKAGCEVFGVFRNKVLISTAATSAATSVGAMLTGVATLPSERGQGLATAVVTALCQDCFAHGLEYVCLYYENPVAARIYHRIGFVDIAGFGMMSQRGK